MPLLFSKEIFCKLVSSDIFNVLYDDNLVYQFEEANYLLNNHTKEEQEVIIVIRNFCSMYMRDDYNKPFDSSVVSENKRTFNINDIDKETAQFLYENLESISNIFIKTRIADSVWIAKSLKNKENIQCAKIAVNGYHKLINNLIENKKLDIAQRYITRVYNLTISMNNQEERERLIKHLEDYLNIEMSPENKFSYCYNILEKFCLTSSLDVSIYNKYFEQVKMIIRKILNKDSEIIPDDIYYESKDIEQYVFGISQPDFIWLQKFYDLAINFAKILKLNINNFLISKAKSFECEAKLMEKQIPITHLLKSALGVYRIIPNQKKEINRLTKYIEQNTTVMPYTTLGTSIDISSQIQMVQEIISGKSFEEALFTLTLLFNTFFSKNIDKNKIKETVLKDKEKNPITFFLPTIILDENGHTKLSFVTDDELLEYHMIQKMYIYNDFSYSLIKEAVRIINLEHHYQIKDILSIVYKSPFVPKEHIYIISKGIFAFLQNDMIEAAHFLILQFEDCLRYLLQPQEITTKILNNGNEENLTRLEDFLDKCKEKQILTDNLVWFFKSYLVLKFKNLRNEIAHGKLLDNYYYSSDIGIICYSILWLVLVHIAKNSITEAKKEEAKNKNTKG